MKDDKERNYFSLRTIFWKCFLPMLKCEPQKVYFSMAKGRQKCYTLNVHQMPLHVST